MMCSVAEVFRSSSMGIIMTGMGPMVWMECVLSRAKAVRDEASCTVYGTPRACAENGILPRVVPLIQIPAQILLATAYRKRA